MSRCFLYLLLWLCSSTISIAQVSVLAKQYKQEELRYTIAFIKDLKNKLDTSFEKQLEYFKEEELGFWNNYSNMRLYIKDRSALMRACALKEDKYFSLIEIEEIYYQSFAEYQKVIRLYRQRFTQNLKIQDNGNIRMDLKLPADEVSLRSLGDHSRNNILIEGFFYLIEDAVSVIPHPYVRFAACATLLLSQWITSNINDEKIIASLREQRQKHPILNIAVLRARLTNNINQFYENK